MRLNPSEGIKLFVLGDARIETSVADIEPGAEIIFAAALYLIVERNGRTSRRRLERLLWPMIPTATASHRLRQTLLKLRRLGLPVAPSKGAALFLGDAIITTDLEEFRRDPLAATCARGGKIALLNGYDPSFSSEFSQWLDETKRELSGTIAHSLLSVIAKNRSQGKWSEVETAANALIQASPFNEEATLALAEAYVMRGAKLEGVRLLDRYLSEIGNASGELKLPAVLMRKRIATHTASPESSSPGETPLIGRGDAMEALGSMLGNARRRSGQACLVWGDAGIGKSRLLVEFSAFASLQGVKAVRAHCRPSDRYRPLSVFIDLVPTLRSMRGAIGCSSDTMKYLDKLTTHREDNSPSIGTQGDGDFVYARVRQALVDLVDAVSEEAPLLILLEDIQRLDDVSRNLLTDLIPWASERRILFLFTSREQRHRWLQDLDELVSSLKLMPLDATSAHELLLAVAFQSGRQIDEDYIAWCVRVAEGNPYFLGELASHWLEAGPSAVAPPSLTAVLAQRISRLELSALQVLQSCTLLGKNSTLDRVEKVLGLEHHRLLQGINELANAGMLILDQSDVNGDTVRHLVPRHELLCNEVEKGLSPPARAFLHRRIAAVLEGEIEDHRSAAIAWEAAKHWQHAGDVRRGFGLTQAGCTHLMELGLCSAAAEAYEKSLDFCSSDLERLRVLKGQAHAYFSASDWSNLFNTSQQVRHLQRYLEPESEPHDEIELMSIRAEWQAGALRSSIDKTLECLQCDRASTNHRSRAGIMALMLLDLACDHDRMRCTYSALRPILNREDAERAHSFECGMVFETACGDLGVAVENARALVAARRNADSIADLMRALSNGAVAARTAGEIVLAREWLGEALHVARSHKLSLATEVPMQVLASVALDSNDLEEASAWYKELVQLPESRYDPSSRTVRDSIGLRLALHAGDIIQAKRLVSADMVALASDPIPYRRTYGLALLLAVQLAENVELDKARIKQLERSHLVARRSSRQAFATFVLVSCLFRTGRTERGDNLLREYLDIHRREPAPAPMHVLDLLMSLGKRSAR